MQYRRFGKTNLQMPVLSCGGMRYQQGWKDLTPAEIDPANQANLEATILRSLELGINHIETARGYGSSESQLGRILPTLPREKMIIQTKVGPTPNGEDFLKTFDKSMENLRLDYVDLLALHGINTQEILDFSLKKGGCLDAARKLQAEGRARHIGFSTHGPTDAIMAAIESNGFDYVNLHWYYVDQINAPCIDAARERDMGMFIISPSDKGGKLYDPPPKLVDMCKPFTPMGFNDLWCLWRNDVHTLSIGAARPTDFDAHVEIVPYLGRQAELLPPILARLDEAVEATLGRDWLENWQSGLPLADRGPGGVNLYHCLRLYTMTKAWDMHTYGKMRYNLFGNGGHWFAGNKMDKMDWDALPAAISKSPVAARIPAALREVHELLNAEDKKRLSQS